MSTKQRLGLVGAGLAALAGTIAAQVPGPASNSYAVVPSTTTVQGMEDFNAVLSNVRSTGRVVTSTQSVGTGLTVESEGKLASAVAIPRTRLNQVSSELLERLTSDSVNKPSVLKQLREAYRTSVRPMFSVSDVAIATDAPTASAALAGELQVNDAFAAAFERARLSGFHTSPAQLQLLPATKTLTDAAASMPVLRRVAAAYAETIDAVHAVLDNPTDLAAQALLRNSAATTYASFVADWPNLKENWEARRIAVRALDGLSRQSELKSVYGIRSEFEPESYQSIFLQSERSVAIHDASGRIICSGFSVTSEWIMTAGHCFTNRSWQDMSATLTVPGLPSARLDFKDAWPDAPKGSLPADAIDYAFVRVEPNDDFRREFASLETKTTAAMHRPLCVRNRPGTFEEPVIVIAQLSADRRVYDHAYIWYPFQVVEDDFTRVSAMTGIRLHRFAEAVAPDSQREQELFFRTNLKSFEDAYATQVGQGAQRRRLYKWTPAEATVKRPMFGFDTDTVKGNSGGAVFARADACLLGVFNGGQPDGVAITEASWREHEFATPISAVLEDLEQLAASLPPQPSSEFDRKRGELITALRQARN